MVQMNLIRDYNANIEVFFNVLNLYRNVGWDDHQNMIAHQFFYKIQCSDQDADLISGLKQTLECQKRTWYLTYETTEENIFRKTR